MRTEEVKLRRYFPGEGMALKIIRQTYDCQKCKFVDSVSYTKEQGALVDENILVSVEEVPLKEYEDWINSTPGLAIAGFSI